MIRITFTASIIFLMLAILTGVIYPLAVTGIGQLAFPYQSNGSIIEAGGKRIGSELIGQQFSDPKYFWGRPSATSAMAYNAASSGGSNLGPSNPALIEAVKQRIGLLKEAPEHEATMFPVDLLTASASGLDPHITPASAFFQAARIAKIRNIKEKEIRALVDKFIEERTMGVLGEKRVNVLSLNIALDKNFGSSPRQ